MKLRPFLVLILAIGIFTLGSAAAQVPTVHPYLVLGDSVPFGFITSAGYEYVNPTNFVGYADYLGPMFRLVPTNASCAGETTGSFFDTAVRDNGCQQYRAYFPLHVNYSGSQVAFAKAFLKAHPDTRLVTIQLGANDGRLLEQDCAAASTSADQYVACVMSGLPTVLQNVATNLANDILALRATGYRGIIIVVGYYSLDYTDPVNTGFMVYLNQALALVATATRSSYADVFTAFQNASNNPFANGQTCVAGLLKVNPQDNTQCDMHPTPSGHRLAAQTIGNTYKAALAAR